MRKEAAGSQHVSLHHRVALWRTPDSPGAGGSRNRRESVGQGHQTTIAEQAEHWPTPDASVRGGINRSPSPGAAERPTLNTLASMWLTPAASSDAAGTIDGKMQRMLTHQAKAFPVQESAWPTPGANDHKGTSQPGQRRGQLDEAAEQLFPRSLRDLAPSTRGDESSTSTPTSRRQLNPRFAEWLMGWEPGWTSLEPLGSASSATG